MTSEGWGAPAPHVVKGFGSTDVRLKMGGGAATMEQEEHHSHLPREQQMEGGASSVEVGEPNVRGEEELSLCGGGGERELISSPSPPMELEGGDITY